MADSENRQPQLPGPLSWLSGNPFQDEVVTFRWLLSAVVIGLVVGLSAKLISGAFAVVLGLLFGLLFAAIAIRVLVYLLSSPDQDSDDQ